MMSDASEMEEMIAPAKTALATDTYSVRLFAWNMKAFAVAMLK